MKKLFTKDERQVVEDKYAENIAYKFMQSPCKKLNSNNKELLLHTTELFYNSFFIIDSVIAKNSRDRKTYCRDEVWDDIKTYIRDDKDIIAEDNDLQHVIGTIIMASTYLFNVIDKYGYKTCASYLTKNLSDNCDSSIFKDITYSFSYSWCNCDQESLHSFMNEYIENNGLISTDIEKILDCEAKDSKTYNSESVVHTSNIRIANRKISSVLIVLNAMYKAGWFTDTDGNKLNNRDNTLNEILLLAFNEKKERQISQMINPSDGAENKQELLLRRLLNEKDINDFINDLVQELLRNAK